MKHYELRTAFIDALRGFKETGEESPQIKTLMSEIFYVCGKRGLLDEDLLGNRPIDEWRRTRGFSSKFETKFWPSISSLFWAFVVDGIISIGTSSGQCDLPFFQITEYGEDILSGEKMIILDPTGVISNLKKSREKIDPVVEEYLAEALSCFEKNCLKATFVMIGCAAEKAILNLIDAFKEHFSKNQSKENFERKIERKRISLKYDEFSSRFNNINKEIEQKTGRDDWKIQIDSMFNLIRYYRNKSGHPIGIKFEKERVLSALSIFPELYILCEELSDYFKSNKTNLM